LTKPRERVVLIGQGDVDDIENAVIKLAGALDFEVVVIDHSSDLTEKPDVLIREKDYELAEFGFRGTDSVIVLTHGDEDVAVLKALSGFKLRYVGLLGNRVRVGEIFSKARRMGVPEAFVLSVRGPVGADIGAKTPAEIALSIMSDVVATKYGKKVIRMDTRKAA
jgi:xanthine dehydrogenase accessory factor